MAEVQKIVPVLKISDMQKAVDFYTGILGFTVVCRAARTRAGAAELLSTGTHLADRRLFPGTL
jgi:catechol 2,3-dioxygenase-like lactoylglutathione lyase family enzyme